MTVFNVGVRRDLSTSRAQLDNEIHPETIKVKDLRFAQRFLE
jgi:hypothetical protein